MKNSPKYWSGTGSGSDCLPCLSVLHRRKKIQLWGLGREIAVEEGFACTISHQSPCPNLSLMGVGAVKVNTPATICCVQFCSKANEQGLYQKKVTWSVDPLMVWSLLIAAILLQRCARMFLAHYESSDKGTVFFASEVCTLMRLPQIGLMVKVECPALRKFPQINMRIFARKHVLQGEWKEAQFLVVLPLGRNNTIGTQ